MCNGIPGGDSYPPGGSRAFFCRILLDPYRSGYLVYREIDWTHLLNPQCSCVADRRSYIGSHLLQCSHALLERGESIEFLFYPHVCSIVVEKHLKARKRIIQNRFSDRHSEPKILYWAGQSGHKQR